MITVEDITARVKTSLPEPVLDDMIKSAAAYVRSYLGGLPANTMKEKVMTGPTTWLTFPAASIESATEVSTNEVWKPNEYNYHAVSGLPPGRRFEIVYEIMDFDVLEVLMRSAMIDLVIRDVVEANMKAKGTAYASETIGDYKYVRDYASGSKNGKDERLEIVKPLRRWRAAARGFYAE